MTKEKFFDVLYGKDLDYYFLLKYLLKNEQRYHLDIYFICFFLLGRWLKMFTVASEIIV